MNFPEVSEAQERTRAADAKEVLEILQMRYPNEEWNSVGSRTAYCKQQSENPDGFQEYWEVVARSGDGRMAVWIWEELGEYSLRIVNAEDAKNDVKYRGRLSRMRSGTKVIIALTLGFAMSPTLQKQFMQTERPQRNATYVEPKYIGEPDPLFFAGPVYVPEFSMPPPQTPWAMPIDTPNFHELPQLKLGPEELALLDATLNRLEEKRKANEKHPAPQSWADRR